MAAAQCAASHPQHQWGYGWPLLGIPDPDGLAKPGYTAAEAAALAAWHRDQQLWLQSLHAHGGSGKGLGAGGATTLAAASSGGGEEVKLRAEVEKLKRELADEKKKPKKGAGKAQDAAAGKARPQDVPG